MARYTTAQLFGSGPPGDDEVGAYIIEAARKRGIPEEDALSVWAGEGRGAWQSNYVKNGRREPSYGPYQLYTGGGLGNAFQRDTGLDPSDPSTWKQGVDYALDTAAKEGWGQWYGAPAHLRARGGYEPQRLSPSQTGKKRYSTQELFAKPQEAPAPAPEPPQAAPEPAPQTPPPQPMSWDEVGRDAGNALTSGLITAGVGLAGLPGEVERLGNQFSRYLNPNVELTEYLPTTEDVDKRVRGAIGDYDYEAKSGAGQLAGAIGKYAPAGIGTKAVRGAAGVLGTAMGAEVGKGVGGDVGEVVGALAGGIGTMKGAIPKTNPKGDASKLYNEIEAAGIAVKGDDFHKFATQDLANDSVIRRVTLNPTLYPKLNDLVESITKYVPGKPKANPMAVQGFAGTKAQPQWNPGTVSWEELDNIRRNVLRVSMRTNDADEARIANHILHRLDAYTDNAQLSSGTMTAREAGQKASEARTLWKRHRKQQEIETILEVAKDDAGRFTLSGNENAIRTGFRQLSKRIAKFPSVANRYTAQEKKIIRQLSRGWSLRGGLSMMSRLAPNFITLPAGAVYAHETGDYGTALGIAGAGMGARALSGAIAKNKAKNLSRLVASGGKRIPTNYTGIGAGAYLATREDD